MGYSVYASYQDVKARKPHRWWHEAIVDDLLIHPLDTMAERAKRLDYSVSFLSIIINTDMFKAAYERRRAEFKQHMDAAIVNKTAEVASKGLDIMLEILEKKRDALPFAAVSETVDRTLQRLGYGVPKPNGTNVAVQVNGNAQVAVLPTVSAEQLAEARQALRNAEQARALEVPEPSSEPKLIVDAVEVGKDL